jgi:hypothetical protein
MTNLNYMKIAKMLFIAGITAAWFGVKLIAKFLAWWVTLFVIANA